VIEPLGHKLIPKIKFLRDCLYRSISVRIYAFELRNTPSIQSDYLIVKKEQFTTDDALQAAMRESGHWNEAELKRRQALGDVCYLALEGSRCVHYSWVTQGYRHNTEIGFEATPDARHPWIYNSYTSATHRGRLIYPQVLGKIAEEANQKDAHLIWIDVQDENRSSVSGVTQAGFVEVAVFKKKLLFSFFVFDRRKTIVNAQFGKDFEKMSPKWT
jgi:hypothetical protein